MNLLKRFLSVLLVGLVLLIAGGCQEADRARQEAEQQRQLAEEARAMADSLAQMADMQRQLAEARADSLAAALADCQAGQ